MKTSEKSLLEQDIHATIWQTNTEKYVRLIDWCNKEGPRTNEG